MHHVGVTLRRTIVWLKLKVHKTQVLSSETGLFELLLLLEEKL